MKWTVETLNGLVDEEIASLPQDMKARFVRVVELIEAVGLENAREPYTSQPTRKE